MPAKKKPIRFLPGPRRLVRVVQCCRCKLCFGEDEYLWVKKDSVESVAKCPGCRSSSMFWTIEDPTGKRSNNWIEHQPIQWPPDVLPQIDTSLLARYTAALAELEAEKARVYPHGATVRVQLANSLGVSIGIAVTDNTAPPNSLCVQFPDGDSRRVPLDTCTRVDSTTTA